MKILIHGDNIEKSREYYFTEKSKLKAPNFLNGEGITFDQVFQITESTSLFDSEIDLIIENLISKNKGNSTEIKKIIDFINLKSVNLILWEQNVLTKTQIGQFKKFSIQEFTYPKKLFVFLEAIKPGYSKSLIKLYHELRETEAAELILFMIIRQFRLFLQISGKYENEIDETKRLAPWQISKVNSQAKLFNNDQLLKLYNQLFEIEINTKTGKYPYTADTSIDFFLSGL